MTLEGSIKRGEKWTRVRAEAVFRSKEKDVEWLDGQTDIVKDIKAYEESLKPNKSAGKK